MDAAHGEMVEEGKGLYMDSNRALSAVPWGLPQRENQRSADVERYREYLAKKLPSLPPVSSLASLELSRPREAVLWVNVPPARERTTWEIVAGVEEKEPFHAIADYFGLWAEERRGKIEKRAEVWSRSGLIAGLCVQESSRVSMRSGGTSARRGCTS